MSALESRAQIIGDPDVVSETDRPGCDVSNLAAK